MTRTGTNTRALLVIVAVFSAVVSLIAGGLMLRIFTSDRYYVWQPNFHADFRPLPGVMPGIEGESNFEINADGLRAHPFDDSQQYRILALGGSTTECLYLDNFEAWPHLLQDALNRRTGLRTWVGNAGRSAHTLVSNIVQLEHLV